MTDEITTEKKDIRHAWKKKTNWGLALYALGQILSIIPVTAPYAPPVITIGSILAGYGIADRVAKK